MKKFVEVTFKPIKIPCEGEEQAKEILFALNQDNTNVSYEIDGRSVCFHTDQIISTRIKDE